MVFQGTRQVAVGVGERRFQVLQLPDGIFQAFAAETGKRGSLSPTFAPVAGQPEQYAFAAVKGFALYLRRGVERQRVTVDV